MHSTARSFTPRGYAGLHAFAIGGQSNAVGAGAVDGTAETNNGRVYMLGADYVYKAAYEPTHDNAGSVESALTGVGVNGHSAWLRMANTLGAAQGRDMLLVPCAIGSTILKHPDATRVQWVPRIANRFDRSTLYGRLRVRAGACARLKGICWVGHETSTMTNFEGSVDLLATYEADWRELLSYLQRDFPGVPIFFAQLGSVQTGSGSSETNLDIAHEYQRLSESTQPGGVANTFMVTSFDLALADAVHISAAGQKILGDRFARAIRANVYGEAIAWRGPRLAASNPVSIQLGDPSKITVQFDVAINAAASNYDGQFRVYLNDTELTTITAARSASGTAVELTWSGGNIPGSGTVRVTYGEKLRPSGAALANVVVDANGIPAPAFRVNAVRV